MLGEEMLNFLCSDLTAGQLHRLASGSGVLGKIQPAFHPLACPTPPPKVCYYSLVPIPFLKGLGAVTDAGGDMRDLHLGTAGY